MSATPTLTNLCDCGKVAVAACSDIDPAGITLPRCRKPICAETHWCSEHRHESGTMGYMGQCRVSADWEREDASDEGFWDLLVAWWRNNFWSNERIANHVWQHLKAQDFKPPRPLPDEFKLRVRGWRFELRDGRMVKAKDN